MNGFRVRRSTFALLAVLLPLLGLFVYVALRSGPLAPVQVTLAQVETRALSPALFGVGTVEARYSYRIGPVSPGRVGRLDVQVGDRVKAGQVLGEIDPVDLEQRIRAQDAAVRRAVAQLREAQARQEYALTQAGRYARLLKVRSTSQETYITKQQELQVAEAALEAAREEVSRVRAEREALVAQRENLRLVAPVDGLVVRREADPGTTVVAGQSVIELVDIASLWVNVRFDQVRATGIADGLPAHIELRSRAGAPLEGRIERIEPLADAITEEILAKVVFTRLPRPLPPIGELAEVTVDLPPLPPGPVIPNAALRREDGRLGVWLYSDGELQFRPVTTGRSDLDGRVLIHSGLRNGDRVVVYSDRPLGARSTLRVVERLAGARS